MPNILEAAGTGRLRIFSAGTWPSLSLSLSLSLFEAMSMICPINNWSSLSLPLPLSVCVYVCVTYPKCRYYFTNYCNNMLVGDTGYGHNKVCFTHVDNYCHGLIIGERALYKVLVLSPSKLKNSIFLYEFVCVYAYVSTAVDICMYVLGLAMKRYIHILYMIWYDMIWCVMLWYPHRNLFFLNREVQLWANSTWSLMGRRTLILRDTNIFGKRSMSRSRYFSRIKSVEDKYFQNLVLVLVLVVVVVLYSIDLRARRNKEKDDFLFLFFSSFNS